MKIKFNFLIIAGIVLLGTLVATAADKPEQGYVARSERGEHLGQVVKATDVIGMKIRNNQDVKLGEVEELAVDIENGRIVEVIVATGGILEIGEKHFAVPPRSFTWDETENVLRLDTSAEKFKAAPAFESSKWDDFSDANHVTEAYRYYGEEAYFEKTAGNKTASKTPTHVEKANKFIGLAVKNSADEKIGKVENLLVSLGNGRIVHVVISTGGFLGIGDELSLVPPSALHYDATSKVILLDRSKTALLDAPHFKSGAWPDTSDPIYSDKVYRTYNVPPYFNTNSAEADNTARNARDREGNTLTPMDQGASAADVEITRNIRKQILSRTDMSVNAKNVKIITINGRVTLRGPVDSSQEKRTVEQIASQVVPIANVDNQLEVKREVSN